MTRRSLWRALRICAAVLFPSFVVVMLVIWELTSVSGSLHERGENPVADASVQLTNEATGESRSAETDGQGSFAISRLFPGVYRVGFSADGFDDLLIPSITVTAGRNSRLGRITLHFPRPKTPKELQDEAEDFGRPFTEGSWTWTDKYGNSCTFEDLHKALMKHWIWLESGRPARSGFEPPEILAIPSAPPTRRVKPAKPATPAPKRCGEEEDTADFDGAKMANAPLEDAILQGTHFTRATLSGADFGGANLFGVDFRDAKLDSASFGDSRLRYAKFWGEKVDLEHANFCDADLTRVNFTGTNLSGASFGPCLSSPPSSHANLSGADFTDANLSGDIQWWAADVAGVLFEPKNLPRVDKFRGATNLERLTYFQNPRPLRDLREQFRQAGLDQERDKITYALNRRQSELLWEGCSPWAVASVPWGESPRTEAQQFLRQRKYGPILLNCVEYGVRRTLFDLTCSYGMSKGRPFFLASGLWIVCTVAFLLVVHYPSRSGVKFVVKRSGSKKLRTREVRIRPKPLEGVSWLQRKLSWLRRERHLLWTMMFFSFLNMFNFHIGEIDPMGKAIALVRQRKYDFKATRRARTLSGLQSVVGGCLILLWLYLLISHPFE